MNRLQFFDMHAEKWDRLMTKKLKTRIEKIIPLFGIRNSEHILDVGSGTGILLPYLKNKTGKKGNVVALDFSQKMLDKAKDKFGDVFKYVKSNAKKTPFEDNTFDRIICFNTFPHFPNKFKVLKELSRILKMNGFLIIAHADTRKIINAHHSKIGGPVSKDHMPDNNTMLALFKKAGFFDIKIKEGKNYYLACCTKS